MMTIILVHLMTIIFIFYEIIELYYYHTLQAYRLGTYTPFPTSSDQLAPRLLIRSLQTLK